MGYFEPKGRWLVPRQKLTNCKREMQVVGTPDVVEKGGVGGKVSIAIGVGAEHRGGDIYISLSLYMNVSVSQPYICHDDLYIFIYIDISVPLFLYIYVYI